MFAALAATACASSAASQRPLPPLPSPLTRATLVGPLCQSGTVCVCGQDPDLPGAPETKRYEIRVGPIPNPLWVTVDDMVLYKSAERATECFYVDLPAGKHRAMVRATGEHGFAARVSISEVAPARAGLYQTFEFECGGPGPCSLGQLRDFRAHLATIEKNLHDPCGSTKVRDVTWQTGRMPDHQHPSDFSLEFVLDIYRFTPEHPPGAPACARAP